MNYKFFISILIFILSVSIQSGAREYKPSEIINPNLADRREYVADPGNYLSAQAKRSVNTRLAELRSQTTAEVAVAIVPDLGDIPVEDFAEQVFTSWGLGKKDVDNGVLLLLSPESRQVRIQTGYGTEGVLPDIVCRGIIDECVIPAMKENDVDAAVTASTAELARIMSDETYAAELKSKYADNHSGRAANTETPIDSDVWMYIGMVFMIVGTVAGGIVYVVYRKRFREGSLSEKALRWRSTLPLFWGLGALSLGPGLLFALLALYHYRHARTRRRKCPHCGHRMERMSEERDNDFLSASQDFEEQLGTVDYDVWVCPECEAVEKIPFIERQLNYTECPNCHTIAYGPVADNILVQPTTRREGVGEKVSECKYCHYRNGTRYRIPKKVDETAALAAGAILGSALGRGGGGGFGSGFGGGFGGGSTGGGGASGSW